MSLKINPRQNTHTGSCDAFSPQVKPLGFKDSLKNELQDQKNSLNKENLNIQQKQLGLLDKKDTDKEKKAPWENWNNWSNWINSNCDKMNKLKPLTKTELEKIQESKLPQSSKAK